MSYSVHLYPRAFEKKFKAAKDRDFLEEKANLVPFGVAEFEHLLEQLELRGFVEGKKRKEGRVFQHKDWGASALLTASGLYLSASGDGTFEILMFGDEVANKKIAKFDPQEATWA